ncbi:MAG: hypothetical protein IPH07_24645 [Deltaproteobacteria bacterium]|nr:hypothetical protein [Deltaproteobacteria bacterium]
MARPQDWPQRLVRFVGSRRAMPFAWGANDCAAFAFAWVREVRPGAQMPCATWTSEREALERLAALGGIAGAASAVLGDPVPAMFAQRGDVVAQLIDGRITLGVVTGSSLVGPGHNGVVAVRVDRRGALAWRV